MPGFSIGGTGQDSTPIKNTVETKRNHRWRWTAMGNKPSADILIVLQKCQRPKFTNEEPVMHHNQEQVYFIGKQAWETITMSFYDTMVPKDCSKEVWEWLNIGNKIDEANVETPDVYKKDGELELVDGKGQKVEKWKIMGAWPKEVSFSDLDYTNTDIALCDVVLRYDRAKRE
ncbi:MAG: phage tail protein [Candidatus Nanopelagicaceae bacterium]|nr:phage tail protein [Candidatus Nanopelagicaceae bacterium]